MPLNRDMDILKHIIDYCNEIDHTMDTFGRDANNKVPWSQIRGMRNVVAHHYGKMPSLRYIGVYWSN